MANDMAAVLDYLALPQAFIGGWAMGAGIVLAFSLRYRQRVKRLMQLKKPIIAVGYQT
jgi:pimeloyl-ACP methyl ester carboxylesterase